MYEPCRGGSGPMLDHLSKLHQIERITAIWNMNHECQNESNGHCYEVKCKDDCEACQEGRPFARYDVAE